MPHLFYRAFKHFFHSLSSLFICISATVQSHILLRRWTRVLTTRSESLPFASARFPSFLPSFLFQWILCTFLHRYTLSLDAFSILPVIFIREKPICLKMINRLHSFNVILIVARKRFFESRDFDFIVITLIAIVFSRPLGWTWPLPMIHLDATIREPTNVVKRDSLLSRNLHFSSLYCSLKVIQ